MMNLEDRLVGEKHVSYVSDSDDENNDDGADGHMNSDQTERAISAGPRTGPKGVLEDYRVYQKMKQIENEERVKEEIALHKKTAFTADPNKFPSDETDDFLDDDDDEFLQKYHEKRMQQLKQEMEEKMHSGLTKYGTCFQLTGEELLEAIEKENSKAVIVVHLYDNNLTPCIHMNKCFDLLAPQHPYVKFCKVNASTAGLSLRFKAHALPAIQVYKDGVLIGNFIKMMDYLDHEFFASDVENFLIESNMMSCLSSMSAQELVEHDYELD